MISFIVPAHNEEAEGSTGDPPVDSRDSRESSLPGFTFPGDPEFFLEPV
jgi:hypothetical protein